MGPSPDKSLKSAQQFPLNPGWRDQHFCMPELVSALPPERDQSEFTTTRAPLQYRVTLRISTD